MDSQLYLELCASPIEAIQDILESSPPPTAFRGGYIWSKKRLIFFRPLPETGFETREVIFVQNSGCYVCSSWHVNPAYRHHSRDNIPNFSTAEIAAKALIHLAYPGLMYGFGQAKVVAILSDLGNFLISYDTDRHPKEQVTTNLMQALWQGGLFMEDRKFRLIDGPDDGPQCLTQEVWGAMGLFLKAWPIEPNEDVFINAWEISQVIKIA